jgi:hypothetical protein
LFDRRRTPRVRKSSGSSQKAMIRRCPNGETPLSAMVGIHEFIRGGERAELKYLSKRRKRNHRDSLSKRRAKREQSKPNFCSGL